MCQTGVNCPSGLAVTSASPSSASFLTLHTAESAVKPLKAGARNVHPDSPLGGALPLLQLPPRQTRRGQGVCTREVLWTHRRRVSAGFRASLSEVWT